MAIEDAGLPSTEALYEHAPCGLLITQPDGTIERVNQTFCLWLGLEREA
ncbi:PAS domain-containing protein, partial [Pseudomonas viridiflava]